MNLVTCLLASTFAQKYVFYYEFSTFFQNQQFLHRIIYFIPTVWLLTTIVFFGIHFSPGDPASITLGLYASDETIAALREELGLDKNIFYQYFEFLGKLVQGDLGKSYHNETAVIELIITAFLPTIILVSVSLSFAVIIGSKPPLL